MILGIIRLAPPHAYANRRWGNAARMQHNTVLRQRNVLMMFHIACSKLSEHFESSMDVVNLIKLFQCLHFQVQILENMSNQAVDNFYHNIQHESKK